MADESSNLKSRRIAVVCSRSRQPIVTHSRDQLALSDTPLWFCLRTQPKREHLAANLLRRELQITCFSPRLRFRKATRRGLIWFVEAMFPGYVFAHFVYAKQHRRVEHASGIQGIVHFGDYLATLDTDTVGALQQQAGEEEIVTIDPEIQIGQAVKIGEGPLQGLEALVTRVLPSKERVRVLLDFLGRSVETEISRPKILPVASVRS